MASSSPPEGRLRRAARLSGRDWADVARAAWYLGRARLRHRRADAAALLRRAQAGAGLAGQDAALAGRVTLAIPRAAARVPWRADCFVQALAAQDWLAAHGIGSRLFIGVRKDSQGFAAHAWLRHGGQTVTGGDFSTYRPIVTPETLLP